MILSILVIPNAKKNEIVGWVDGALKVRVSAPPIEGRANHALIEFLAKIFNLAPSEIEIEKGMGGKRKRVSLPIDRAELDQFLLNSKGGSA